MGCYKKEYECVDKTYKIVHFCPIRKGDSLKAISIECTKKDLDGVEHPLNVSKAVMQLYKYGREDIQLPTKCVDNVVVIKSIRDTSHLSAITYTYSLTFHLDNGSIITYLKGDFPVE